MHGLEAHVLFAVDTGSEGDNVIFASHLETMASKIKEAYTTLTELLVKCFDGLFHRPQFGITQQYDFKPKALECSGYVGGIVDRITQGPALIGRIANNQGSATLLR